MKLLLVSLLVAPALARISANSSCSYVAPVSSLPNNTKLPDPFSFVGTSNPRVATKADWACRRQQISALLQAYELGTLPPKPDNVTAVWASSNTMYITSTAAGKSASFEATITLPATGTAPYPAVIAYGFASIPVPSNVATIVFNNDDIAQETDQTSRGQGAFYTIYGSDATAGATMAWAWGVSRIVDALELLATPWIDTRRLAVTGCSRDGKGALVAGAFEERIALTIAQESGSGGDACWRLSDYENNNTNTVQTAHEIVRENVWFAEAFDQFVNGTAGLPFDHHLLAGLVAPRALLAIENTAYEWLGPYSSAGCMLGAKPVWDALGVPENFGFSQVGNHSHCAFPADQQPELTAFFDRFLLNDTSVNTTIFRTPETVDSSQWIDWTTPTLT